MTAAINPDLKTPRMVALQIEMDACTSELHRSLNSAAFFAACAVFTGIRFSATPVRITFGVVSVAGFIASGILSVQADKKHGDYKGKLDRLSDLRSKAAQDTNKIVSPATFLTNLKRLLEAMAAQACTQDEVYAIIRDQINKATLNFPSEYNACFEVGVPELTQEVVEVIRSALREKWSAFVQTPLALSCQWEKTLCNRKDQFMRLLGFQEAEFEEILKEYCPRLFKAQMDSKEPLYSSNTKCIFGEEMLHYILKDNDPENEAIRIWVKGQLVEYITSQYGVDGIVFQLLPERVRAYLTCCPLQESEIQEIIDAVQINVSRKQFAQFLSGACSYVKLRKIVGDLEGALKFAEKQIPKDEFSQLKDKLIASLAIERYKRELGISKEAIDISKDPVCLDVSEEALKEKEKQYQHLVWLELLPAQITEMREPGPIGGEKHAEKFLEAMGGCPEQERHLFTEVIRKKLPSTLNAEFIYKFCTLNIKLFSLGILSPDTVIEWCHANRMNCHPIGKIIDEHIIALIAFVKRYGKIDFSGVPSLDAPFLDKDKAKLHTLGVQHQLTNINFLVTYIDQKKVDYKPPYRFVKNPVEETVYKQCKVEFDGYVTTRDKMIPDVKWLSHHATTPEEFERSASYLPEELKTQMARARNQIKELDQTSRAASEAVYEKLGGELESVTISEDLQKAIDTYNTEVAFSMKWPTLLKEYTLQCDNVNSQYKALDDRNKVLKNDIATLALDLTEEKGELEGKHEAELEGNTEKMKDLTKQQALNQTAIDTGKARLTIISSRYEALMVLIKKHNASLHEKFDQAKKTDEKIAQDTVRQTQALLAEYRKALDAYFGP